MRFRKFKRYVKGNNVTLGKLTVTGPTVLGASTIASATITTLTANGGNLNGLTSITGLATLVVATGTITNLNIGNAGSIRVPVHSMDLTGVQYLANVNKTGSFYVSGDGTVFFINVNGTWKSGALGTG